MWLKNSIYIFLTVFSIQAMSYEQAYPKTDVDIVEVKSLPESRFIETSISGEYFDESDSLFRRLFNYIKDNDISMTIPVEANVDKAQMRFYLGTDAAKNLTNTDNVFVTDLPARNVVSVGGKGSYSEDNINEALAKAEEWISNQKQWQQDGEPYAVYWNGPFTLWFLKRYEVHVPIKTTQ